MKPGTRNQEPGTSIYGIHPILEELSADACRIEKVFVAQGSGGPKIQAIIERARQRRIPVQFQPRDWIRRKTGTVAHQNVLATVTEFQFSDPEELLDRAHRASEPALFLVLDQIEDPQNLGAIVRSAEASAVNAIFMPERHSAPLGAAVEKASAGALAHVAIARVINVSRLLEQMKKKGIWTVAVDTRGRQSWYEPDYTVPLALVLGGEGGGVRRLIRETCDFQVRLPMRGKVESLSVSAATAVLLYEVLRQRSRLLE